MATKPVAERILFGLILKRHRTSRKMSFAELSSRSGLSVSYLNEIEKGKKYPKDEKIAVLAKALEVKIDVLKDPIADKTLAPVRELLESNFLNDLPLDLFGIELTKIAEIIANSPAKVGAFVSSLVELSRSYAFREEHFYLNALRSYLELHNNYFEEIEEAVEAFAKAHNFSQTEPVSTKTLARLLEDEYDYTIVESGLDAYEELASLRALFVPSKRQLLLNSSMADIQKAFQFGKELGFQALGLDTRANTSSLRKIRSFDEVLSHFKAGYFSAALLLPKKTLIQDLNHAFAKQKWDSQILHDLLKKYKCAPEVLSQRLTNILPEHFKMHELFFMRFVHNTKTDNIRVDRELHLSGKHHPHGNSLNEKYCRRWVSIQLLNDLKNLQNTGSESEVVTGIQRSVYLDSEDEYLCFSIARPAYPSPTHNVSMVLGLKLTDELKKKIRFWNDPDISQKLVHTTCERCSIQDCKERAAEPIIVQKRKARKEFYKAIEKLEKNGVKV